MLLKNVRRDPLREKYSPEILRDKMDNSNSKIKILIVDHDSYRLDGMINRLQNGYNQIICTEPEMLEKKYMKYKPDICIIDMHNDSFEQIRRIYCRKKNQQCNEKMKILFMTNPIEKIDISEAKAFDTKGLINSSSPPHEFHNAIKEILKGEVYFDEDISPKDIKETLDCFKKNKNGTTYLTPCEIEVLEKIARGLSPDVICDKRGTTRSGFEHHIKNIKEKKNLNDTYELNHYAHKYF